MLKTLFVWLLLNVLIFTTCIHHKADLVVLHVFLLACHFSNFFLAAFWSFIKWPPMRSCIFLFLSNAIVDLLTNTLRNSGLICRMCQFFLTISDMFGSVLLMLTLVVCFSCCYFFHYFDKNFFPSIKPTFSICLFKLSLLCFLSKRFCFITIYVYRYMCIDMCV